MILKNVQPLSQFCEEKSLIHNVGKKTEYYHYVYLLISQSDEAILEFKIGETQNLEKRMRQYFSYKSPYYFSCAIKIYGNSKNHAESLGKAKETKIKKVLEQDCKVELSQGTEHFYSKNITYIKNLLTDLYKGDFISKETQLFKHITTPDIFYPDKIFPQQEKAGKEIVELFKECNMIHLKAKTQGGKTNTCFYASAYMAETIRKNSGKGCEFIFATALSSVEWKRQTLGRTPVKRIPEYNIDAPIFKKENIIMLDDLSKSVKNKKDYRNCVFFIDESQRGSKRNQTLSKFFINCLGISPVTWKESPKDTIKILKEKNIKICFVSATDFYTDTLTELEDYADYIKSVKLDVSDKYKGWIDYYSNGSINELVKVYDSDFGDLSTRFNRIIEELLNGNDPNRYILLRLEKDLDPFYLEELIYDTYGDDIRVINHFGDYRIDSEILNIKPNKPTIIVLKELWRMAKTISIRNIAIVFDRYIKSTKSQTVDTILQGLLGRITGYKVGDVDIKIFTNLEIIENYLHKNGCYNLDAKTKVSHLSNKREYQITSISNHFLEINKATQEQLSVGNEKGLRDIIRSQKYFIESSYLRSLPKNKKRWGEVGISKWSDLDKSFDDINSYPPKRFIESAMHYSKNASFWINYNPEFPSKVKITKIVYKEVIKNETLKIIKQEGVLPVNAVTHIS